MCEFVLKSHTSTVHAGDLQYRFSDPSVDRKKAVRIWEDDGNLVGFGFLHILCNEFIFETKAYANRSELERQIVEWALEQFNKVAADRYDWDQSLTTSVAEFDSERIALLEKKCFTRDEDYRICLDYSLDLPIPAAKLPEGFTMSYLKDVSEVQDYVAAYHRAFLFDYLNVEWRRKVLQMPGYVPELDLIVVAPDGEFSAICFCWLEQSQNDSDVKKKGYIQSVGTQPKFQNMGIGQSLFAMALQRLKAFGAQVAVGYTDADNKFALQMYVSAGVRPLYKMNRYSWESNVQAKEKKPQMFQV